MKSLLINFSGHPLNQQARDELSRNHDVIVESKPVEIIFDDTVQKQIESIIKNLGVKMDGSFALTIVPPGQSTYAILLISYLHGIFGHFPNVCYLELSPAGLYLPKEDYILQPRQLRTAGRQYRFEQYDT